MNTSLLPIRAAAACLGVLVGAVIVRGADVPHAPPAAPSDDRANEPAPGEAGALALLSEEGRGAVLAALRASGDRRGQWVAALRQDLAEQRKGLAFLLANMPERDLRSLDAPLVLENVALAYEARARRPWGGSEPEEVFQEALLPYANLNERRERWRPDFVKQFAPLVKDCKTATEAALALNAGVFKQVNVQYHPTKRPKPDQCPSESIAAGFASCSGLSILLVDACRAVGVPARVVGTPAWAVHRGDANGNHGGNHTWVEFWDGQWHVLGASEVSPPDQTWFLGNAALALPEVTGRDPGDADDHHIYAACLRDTGVVFPLVWDASVRYVRAEDVTAAYANRTPVKVHVDGAEGAAHLTLRQQGRLVADLEVDGTTTLVLSAGQKYEAMASVVPKGGGARRDGAAEVVEVPAGNEPALVLHVK